jgi:hypothetical protein
VREEAFERCDDLLDQIADAHSKTAGAFIKKRHPLLIPILSYQDGMIHALQRISRMRRTGEYHSINAVHSRVHGYDRPILEHGRRNDFWNAAYAHGYQAGMMFLLLNSKGKKAPKPPFYDVPLDIEFSSLAAVLRFPTKSIPKPILKQSQRLLKRLSGTELVPDHTPFL